MLPATLAPRHDSARPLSAAEHPGHNGGPPLEAPPPAPSPRRLAHLAQLRQAAARVAAEAEAVRAGWNREVKRELHGYRQAAGTWRFAASRLERSAARRGELAAVAAVADVREAAKRGGQLEQLRRKAARIAAQLRQAEAGR